MSKEEIDNLIRKRDSCRMRIREIKDDPSYINVLIGRLIEFNELTEQLISLGRNVKIVTDYLTYDYWGVDDNIIDDFKANPNKYKTRINPPPTKKTQKKSPGPKPTQTKKSTSNPPRPKHTPTKNKYIIYFAWSGNGPAEVIEKVKEYFSDMEIKMLDQDTYIIKDKENIIKYEFTGTDHEYRTIKYSAQFILDILNDGTNMAIYGKKIE